MERASTDFPHTSGLSAALKICILAKPVSLVYHVGYVLTEDQNGTCLTVTMSHGYNKDWRGHPTLDKFTGVNQAEIGSDFFLNHVDLRGTCKTLKTKHSVTTAGSRPLPFLSSLFITRR